MEPLSGLNGSLCHVGARRSSNENPVELSHEIQHWRYALETSGHAGGRFERRAMCRGVSDSQKAEDERTLDISLHVTLFIQSIDKLLTPALIQQLFLHTMLNTAV